MVAFLCFHFSNPNVFLVKLCVILAYTCQGHSLSLDRDWQWKVLNMYLSNSHLTFPYNIFYRNIATYRKVDTSSPQLVSSTSKSPEEKVSEANNYLVQL